MFFAFHSKPLHDLELVSFSTIQMLPRQHLFFLFLGLVNIFMGSLHSIPLHKLELISFLAIPGNSSFLLLGLINMFMGSLLFQTSAQIGVK